MSPCATCRSRRGRRRHAEGGRGHGRRPGDGFKRALKPFTQAYPDIKLEHSKEAQTHWAKEVETNSRRLGVEPGNPQFLPPKGVRLFQVDAEENLPEVIKTQDIARAVIK